MPLTDVRCRNAKGKILQRGVIASQETRISFRDGLPSTIVTDYYVPLPIHYQWCEWGSEQFGAE